MPRDRNEGCMLLFGLKRMYEEPVHNIKKISNSCFNKTLEQQKRTLAKTAIYRGSTTALLFGLGWILTGDLYDTSIITILFNVIATGIYYFHERMWGKISWGILLPIKKADTKYAEVMES